MDMDKLLGGKFAPKKEEPKAAPKPAPKDTKKDA